MRNAAIMLTVFYSLPRQMVPQSLNDVEAVFLHKSDGYCNLPGASAFHQDSLFSSSIYVVFTVEKVVNLLFTRALFSKQSRCSHFTDRFIKAQHE